MDDNLLQLTTEIVSAYSSTNALNAEALVALIKSVFETLSTIETSSAEPPQSNERATAAQIKKSIKPDHLISFEDGRPYKTLKRHLTKRGLTFADYKSKWGLPNDYPGTAPSYSAMRSEMAKTRGLGNRHKDAPVAPPAKSSRSKATA